MPNPILESQVIAVVFVVTKNTDSSPGAFVCVEAFQVAVML